MRLKRVTVPYAFLIQELMGHPLSEVSSDMPGDAEIVSVDIDGPRQRVGLYVRSTTFDDIPEGWVIPDWTPTFKTQATELTLLANLVRNASCLHCGKMPYDA